MYARAALIKTLVYMVQGITAAPENMSPWVAVICIMIYEVKEITTAPETMSPWATVIGSKVYKVWGITAGPETMCPWAAVVCPVVPVRKVVLFIILFSLKNTYYKKVCSILSKMLLPVLTIGGQTGWGEKAQIRMGKG